MKIITGVLSSACLMLAFAGTSQAKEWRGLTPLRSKRAEVERLLGKASTGCKCAYNLPDVKVYVKYASGRRDSMWGVPKDTVISIEIYPAKVLPRLADLNIDGSKFRIEEDRELPGIFQYENEEEGFTIVVEDGLARAFYYTATAKDKLLYHSPRRA